MAELDQRVTNYLAKFKRKHKALYRDTSLVGRMLFMLRISNGTVIAS